MVCKVVKVTNPTGLHTRPGTQFVKLAKGFAADVTVSKADKSFSAKSLMKLMKVGISQGDEIEICCQGEDEQQALDRLTEFVANLTD